MAEPEVEDLGCGGAGHVLPRKPDLAARWATQARQRLDQLGLPVAVDACEADDLAAASFERDSSHHLEATIVRCVQIAHGEHRVGRRRGRLVDSEEHLPANHHSRERLLRRAGSRDRLDHLAPPQDGDAIGDLEHLVQLVADEDDRQQSLPRQPPQKLEELVRLLRCEHAGRLVEDQDVRVPVERLDDLDALLLADGDVLYARIRVDCELEGFRELAHAPPRRAVIEKHACLRRLGRKHDVLGDGHDRDQHEVLVHHPDPSRDCVPRRVDPDGLALEEDPAVVRVVEAVEDVHQGRLPGAVLAQ